MVKVDSSIKKWLKKWTGNMEQLKLFMAATMQANRGMLFIHSGSYNGHKTWKPPKLRDGMPLRDKGTLMKSIGPIVAMKTGRMVPVRNEGTLIRYGTDTVTIGTTLKKARILNDGGTIVPVKSKLLWIPLSTNKDIASKAVTKGIKKHKKTGAASLGRAPIVRLKNGKFFMLAKKVVIPPRPFDKLNSQDKDEIAAAMSGEIARCLNSA